MRSSTSTPDLSRLVRISRQARSSSAAGFDAKAAENLQPSLATINCWSPLPLTHPTPLHKPSPCCARHWACTPAASTCAASTPCRLLRAARRTIRRYRQFLTGANGRGAASLSLQQRFQRRPEAAQNQGLGLGVGVDGILQQRSLMRAGLG
ncbi:MAG: hypothetical protein RJA63_2481 [Pseudomonadota bacterium]